MSNYSSSFDRRNRCINCSFLIPRNYRRHSINEVSNAMTTILQSWINPTQLSSENNLCMECFQLLQNRAGTSEASVSSLPALGHRRICYPCGNSILRAPRTYLVRQDREERDILLRLVPLHLVSRLERVCAACWRAATRQVKRQRQHDTNRPLADTTSSSDSTFPIPPPLPPPPRTPTVQVPDDD